MPAASAGLPTPDARPTAPVQVATKSLVVLVVDDQDMQRLVVRRTLSRHGYTVVEAGSAEDAQRVIDQQHVDIVLSDWVMDGMSGTELCRWLRQRKSAPYVYCILMSARDRREDMLEGLQSGADDFLRKPLDVEELQQRLRAGVRVLELQSDLRARQHELERAYQQIQADLDAAARFQRALLPRSNRGESPQGLAWLFMASRTVSGDALNYFELDDRHLAFYLLDVAGHGVASAMVAMNVAQYLNPAAEGCVYDREPQSETSIRSPAATVGELNRRICSRDLGESYLTCVYGVLDRWTGRVRLVRAAHPSPLLIQPSAKPPVQFVEQGDMPVGLFSQASFTDIEAQLTPGSRLVVCSDGLTDCLNEEGEAFGEHRLASFFVERDHIPLRQAVDEFEREIRLWRGSASTQFEDDLSLIVIEHVPPPNHAVATPAIAPANPRS